MNPEDVSIFASSPDAIGSPAFPDPLWVLPNWALYDTALALELACGRNRSMLRKKHRQHLCYLADLLNPEFDQRSYPAPVPPFSSGNNSGRGPFPPEA